MNYCTNGESYMECRNTPPEGYILCSARPSADYVIADNWSDDPTNPAVCWRPKSPAEINAEQDAAEDRELDDTKLIKAVALWVANLHGITPAQARQQIKAIYKGL